MRLLVVVLAFGISTVSFAAASKFAKSTPQLLEKGKSVYTTNCAICHGDKGDGNGAAGAAMNPKPRNFIKDTFKAGIKPDEVLASITKGLPGTAMAGYSYLSEEDRWALTHYVLAFRKK